MAIYKIVVPYSEIASGVLTAYIEADDEADALSNFGNGNLYKCKDYEFEMTEGEGFQIHMDKVSVSEKK